MKCSTIIFHFLRHQQLLKFFIVVLCSCSFQTITAQTNGIVWADSCTTGSFYGKLLSEGYSDFTQVHKYIGGGMVLVGTIKKVYGQLDIQKNDCNIMRLDAAGNLMWSKFIGITDPAVQVDLRSYASVVASNNDVVVVLAVNAPPLSGNYVVRLNSLGLVVWQKQIPYLNNGLSSDAFKDIIETTDGGFLLTGASTRDGLFVKINGDGSLAWRNSIISSSVDITAVTEGAAAYYLAGNFTNLSTDFTENFIAKANKSNGDVEWINWISFAGTVPMTAVTEYEFDQMNYRNGVIALSGNTRPGYAGNNKNAQIVLYVDESANVISAARMENARIATDPANIFHGQLYDPFTKAGVQFHNNDSSDYYVYRLKNDNTVMWAWRVEMPGAQSANDLKVLYDSSVVIAGFSRNPGVNVSASLLKTSTRGKLENCISNSFTVTTAPQTVLLQPNNSVFQTTSAAGASAVSALNIINGTGFTWQLECSNETSCRMSKIRGNKTVCKNAAESFAVTRGGNCRNPVSFSSNAAVTIGYTSDSTADITFLTEGNVMLYATMQAACGELKDSINVQVKNSGGNFSLGPDTTICPANKIALKVSGGFALYQWQDGSSDSAYTATVPGKYYLTARDVCGASFSDTVNIAAATSFEFSVGPDRIKCNADTLQISSTAGFSNYKWSPVYNINSVNSRHVIVNPLVDTLYTVAAEKYPGCLVYDTVHIQVKYSPQIRLGADTNICGTATLLLDAGAGFDRYRWNDAAAGATHLITQPGIYSVTGYYANGCSAADTILISSDHCFEDIFIPNAFAPSGNGSNKTFKPVATVLPGQYHLQVFTRWGQSVYETADVSKGWDGTIKGKDASGVFVWICTFRFQGKLQQVKKGTVVLIR